MSQEDSHRQEPEETNRRDSGTLLMRLEHEKTKRRGAEYRGIGKICRGNETEE